VQEHTSQTSSAHLRQQQSGAAEQLRFVVYDPFRFRTGWLYDENTVLLEIQDVILIFFVRPVNRFKQHGEDGLCPLHLGQIFPNHRVHHQGDVKGHDPFHGGLDHGPGRLDFCGRNLEDQLVVDLEQELGA